jgi:hypothetical protein
MNELELQQNNYIGVVTEGLKSPGRIVNTYRTPVEISEIADIFSSILQQGSSKSPLYNEKYINNHGTTSEQPVDSTKFTKTIVGGLPDGMEGSPIEYWTKENVENYLLEKSRQPGFILAISWDKENNTPVEWLLGYEVNIGDMGIFDIRGNLLETAFYLDTTGICSDYRNTMNEIKLGINLSRIIDEITQLSGPVLTRIYEDITYLNNFKGHLGFRRLEQSIIDSEDIFHIRLPHKDTIVKPINGDARYLILPKKVHKLFSRRIGDEIRLEQDNNKDTRNVSIKGIIQSTDFLYRGLDKLLSGDMEILTEEEKHDLEAFRRSYNLTNMGKDVAKMVLLGPVLGYAMYPIAIKCCGKYSPILFGYEAIPLIGGMGGIVRTLLYFAGKVIPTFIDDLLNDDIGKLQKYTAPIPLVAIDFGYLLMPLMDELLRTGNLNASKAILKLRTNAFKIFLRKVTDNFKKK